MNLFERTKIKRQIFKNLYKNGYHKKFHDDYVNILNEEGVPVDGVFALNNWIMYSWFCEFVAYNIKDKNATIIDWGGGWGQITKMLEFNGFTNVKSYDQYVCHPKHDILKKRINMKAIFGTDPKKLAIDSNFVDVFISSGVLEHVREDGIGTEENSLKEIYRVMKPGGIFFIWNLPRILSLPDFKSRMLGRWYHKYRFTRKKIVTLLENQNFEILYLDKHKFLPDVIYNLLMKVFNLPVACKIDEVVSHIFPMSLFARDFIIIARKK